MAEQPGDEPDAPENLPAPAPQTTADYEKFAKPEKPIRNWTKIATIIVIVLLVAGAGGGGYWYLKNHKSKPKPTTPAVAQTAPAKIVTATKSYTSSNLNLGFSYPEDWTVVDNNGATLTATSPATDLKTADGQTVSGKIVMTIQNNQPASLPGFTAGNAIALLASQKITYTKPTQTQRANTYVTYITYASTKATNALDAIYISGDNGYTLGQAVPQSDLIQVSPVVSLTFVDSTGKAVSLAASDWQNSAFSTPLLDMLKSLAIS